MISSRPNRGVRAMERRGRCPQSEAGPRFAVASLCPPFAAGRCREPDNSHPSKAAPWDAMAFLSTVSTVTGGYAGSLTTPTAYREVSNSHFEARGVRGVQGSGSSPGRLEAPWLLGCPGWSGCPGVIPSRVYDACVPVGAHAPMRMRVRNFTPDTRDTPDRWPQVVDSAGSLAVHRRRMGYGQRWTAPKAGRTVVAA